MKVKFLLPIVLSIALPVSIAQAFNVALNKPVIDFSNQYSGLPGYEAGNVTDGSTSDIQGTNYWVTDNNAGLNAYFTLDLQGVFSITEIDLRNTHNDSWDDRGTGAFHILASTAVDSSSQLISPTTILSGTLSDVSGEDPIAADVFTISNGLAAGDYRYLKFVVDSLAVYVNAGGAGLNEIEVQADIATNVPESSTNALIFCGVLIIFLSRSGLAVMLSPVAVRVPFRQIAE